MIRSLLTACVAILFLVQPVFTQKAVDKKELIFSMNARHIYQSVSQENKNLEGGADIELALPYGNITFRAIENNIMSLDFKHQHPEIKCYDISSKDGSYSGKLTINSEELFITMHGPKGIVHISPDRETGLYILEDKYHRLAEEHVTSSSCGNNHQFNLETAKLYDIPASTSNKMVNTLEYGDLIRIYRMAIVCTGEYYQANGANPTLVRTQITSTVASLQEVYDNDLSVQFSLLTPRLFSDPNNDPFTPDELPGADGRPTQANDAVSNDFSDNDYDIGHVVHETTSGDNWSSGGVAQLRSVCRDGSKAAGWSGSFNTSAMGFVFLFGHEVGHMFGATHTFNGTGESCTDAISETTAYEIGSGTSIMSYNGICQADNNIALNGVTAEEDHFHVASLSQMIDHITDFSSCPTTQDANNAIPEVDANPCNLTSYIVPRRTPYFISGTATDTDLNDVLSYSWEQFDEDGTGTPTQGLIGNQAANSMIAPQIRKRAPMPTGVRYIPSLENVLSNTVDPFEVNSNTRRDINLRLVVRDNEGAFGVDDFLIETSGLGPFLISSPNGGENLNAGDNVDINWSTGGSDDLCDLVDIRLSIDGGNTYPLTIAEGVNYDAATFSYDIPAGLTSTDKARVMISCTDNECIQFYSVSRLDFSISSSCIAPSSSLCDTTGVTANAGDPALNLSISSVTGVLADEAIFTQISPTTELLPVAVLDPTETSCSEIINSRRSTSTFIEVGDDGNYFFDMEYDFQGDFSFVSVFREDLFNQNNVCPSFVGSTVRQASAGGTSVSRFVSNIIPLEACVTYRVVAYSFASGTVNTRLNSITGDGLVFTDDTPDQEYSYAYLAINKATGKIVAYDDNGDFTSLVAGNYVVYGFSYKSAGSTPPQLLDLTTLIGKSIIEVASAGDCIKVSDDYMRIDVETSCVISNITLGNQGNCNPMDNSYTQELILEYDLPPASSRISVNGQLFDQTASPQTITLVNLPSDGNPVSVNVFFEDDPICGSEFLDLFTAPENCCPIDIPFSANTVACEGEPLILDGGTDGTSYDWFLDGAPLANSNPTINATTPGTYQVIVTTASGCSKSASTIVSFEDKPSLSSVDDTTICDNQSYDFNITTNADSITLLLEGSILEINPISFSISDAGMYDIVATADNGCQVIEEFNVSTIASPEPNLGLDVQACTGDMITLDAGIDETTYSWSRDGTDLGVDNRTLPVSIGGQYIVTAINTAMCMGTDTVEVSFTDNPTIVFTNTDPRICNGSSIDLQVNSSATDINWTLDGVAFTPTSSSLHTADQPGTYMVVASFGPSCQAETMITVTEIEQPDFQLPEESIAACIGTTVAQSISVTADTYEWTKDGVFFSDQQSIEITAPGVYVAVATNDGLCMATDQVTIDFVDGPTVDVQGDNVFCTGDNTVLTLNTNGTSIQWYQNGQIIDGATNSTLVVDTEGEYQVQVLGATANCVAEQTVIIMENPVPTVALGDDRSICLGEEIEINANTGNMGDTYSWTRDGIAFALSPVVTITESGIYELVVQNSFDCSQSDAFSVTVLNPPSIDINAPATICEGDTELISVTSNATQFEWSVNGNIISGQTQNSLTINQGGTYTVIASSADLCSVEEMVTVNNIALPIVDLGADTELCPGQSLSLTAGNHSSYLWSDDSTNPDLQISNTDVSVQTTETFRVTVTNSSGCISEDEINISFFPVVVANIDAPSDGVCQDGSIIVTATGGSIYQWTGPAGTIDDPNSATVELSPTVFSSYSVVVSDGVCPDNEDMALLDLDVFSAIDFTAGPDTCIVIGQEYEMQGSGGAFYSWDNTSTIIGSSTISNAIISPQETTVYTLEITDENGCSYQDQVEICVIIDPLEIFKAVNVITPNDDGKNDALTFPGLEAFQDNRLTVFNRWGNIVFEKRGYQVTGELWDGTDGGEKLPADVYYYVLEFGDFTIKSAITLMRE